MEVNIRQAAAGDFEAVKKIDTGYGDFLCADVMEKKAK